MLRNRAILYECADGRLPRGPSERPLLPAQRSDYLVALAESRPRRRGNEQRTHRLSCRRVDSSGPILGPPQVVPAALGRRAAARILDALLVLVGPAALTWWEANRAEGFDALAPLFLLLAWLLVGFPVYEMVSVGWFGQSVGKAAMRVHVVTTAGSLPSWRQATARAALLALPMTLLLSPLFPVTLGYLIWLVVDLTRRPQHRSWVDRLAGTVVVENRPGPTRRHGRVRIAPTKNEPGISGTVLRRIALGVLALSVSGAAYYLFAATPWWPLGVAVLAGVVAGVAAGWGHGPSWRAAVVCTFGGCALVAVATVRAGPPPGVVSARLLTELQDVGFVRRPRAASCPSCVQGVELWRSAGLTEASDLVAQSARAAGLDVDDRQPGIVGGIVTVSVSGGRVKLLVFVADRNWGGTNLSADEALVFWDADPGLGPLHD